MSSEETKVAVMQEQINYIKKQVDTIIDKLDKIVDSHQLQIDRMQVEVDKRFEGLHTRLDSKADKFEVEKINTILSRINWFIIMAVLSAILGLVIIEFK